MDDNILSTHSGIIALISAIFGGSAVKFLDRWFSLRRNRAKGETEVTLELHRELAQVREETKAELDTVRKDLDAWKQKYYALLEAHQGIVAEHLHIQLLNKELEMKMRALESRLTEVERVRNVDAYPSD